MITYYKLFDVLKRRQMTVEQLRIDIQASSSTMTKLRKNQNVAIDVIDRICDRLDCQPGDLMEFEKSLKS
ncbi:XRE family transcriptional regulator [Lacrimispora amygdalina]|uniref:XRE family transcriptional regulator n=1 Tax=Lacrimispora amygdalina TaxID=253257 RepID=A0A3E2NBJ4_9FIRM|nr:helix-turn-helix transcriptional regulator [Clostridium indicum]RFZ78250.1 XRE family transcriptional regulator [Clostridium indicum]